MAEASIPTNYLRFVLRDGKRILQQLHTVFPNFGAALNSETGQEWRDVPLEEEA